MLRTRWTPTNWKQRLHTILPECTLLALLLSSFVLHPAPTLPPLDVNNDIAWGAGYVLDISRGTSVFEIPEPYLRYVPQVVLLHAVELVVSIPRDAMVEFYSAYSLLLTAVVVPAVAYLHARSSYGRLTGLLTLAILLVVVPDRFSIVPHVPTQILDAIPNQTGWMSPSIPLFGHPYHLTISPQYVFPLPFVLGAFYFQKNSTSTTASVLVGLMLGIAGSIQVIQGLIASLVVGVDHVRQRTWRALAVTATVAMVVAVPNVFVFLRFTSQWLNQGGDRISLAPMNLVYLGTMFVVGALVVEGLLYLFPTLGTGESSVQPFERVWVLTTGVLWLATIPLAANWYRWLIAGLFKYGLIIWVAVLLTPRVRTLLEKSRIVGDA